MFKSSKRLKGLVTDPTVPSTSDRRLIELENQVQCLMEAHLAPKQPIQVNKITYSCEICSGPHNTQYCMENSEKAFIDYSSSRTDEAGDEAKESAKPSATEYKDQEILVESKEEFEEETEEETEEEEEDNPEHFNIFPRRVRRLKVVIGNFTYECDFVVVEGTTSVIDHDLGSLEDCLSSKYSNYKYLHSPEGK
ncbi:hypothetical protein Tco_1163012 [Tanacetum coccineum]